MMKILMITENFGLGGKERRIIELLKRIEPDSSIACEVILLKDKIEYNDIFNFKRVRITILHRKIKKDPTVLIKLYRIMRHFKPDIVHSWGPMPSVYAFPLTSLLGIRLINNMVSNAHVKRFSKTWFRARLSFPFSDIIVSNSCAGLSAYKVKPSKGLVIYNGFDFQRLKKLKEPETVKEKYNIRGKFIIGMLAQFQRRKDFTTFLSAAVSLIPDYPDISFVAAGSGHNLDTYKKQYGSGYDDRIVFTGPVDDAESLINVFDIGVLTTNTTCHQEGISNSIMEYMACGKPVISTRGGGTNEIVEHKRNGLLIDPFSPEELKESILLLYHNQPLRDEFGRNGRETVRSSFSMDKMVNDYLELYKSLMPPHHGQA